MAKIPGEPNVSQEMSRWCLLLVCCLGYISIAVIKHDQLIDESVKLGLTVPGVQELIIFMAGSMAAGIVLQQKL